MSVRTYEGTGHPKIVRQFGNSNKSVREFECFRLWRIRWFLGLNNSRDSIDSRDCANRLVVRLFCCPLPAPCALPLGVVQIFQFEPAGDEIFCFEVATPVVGFRETLLADVQWRRPGVETLPTPPNGLARVHRAQTQKFRRDRS